jgi:hypothetical protein
MTDALELGARIRVRKLGGLSIDYGEGISGDYTDYAEGISAHYTDYFRMNDERSRRQGCSRIINYPKSKVSQLWAVGNPQGQDSRRLNKRAVIEF